jgi:hypothetical protein
VPEHVRVATSHGIVVFTVVIPAKAQETETRAAAVLGET